MKAHAERRSAASGLARVKRPALDSKLLYPTYFWTHQADGSQFVWCRLRLKRLDTCAASPTKMAITCMRTWLPAGLVRGSPSMNAWQTKA